MPRGKAHPLPFEERSKLNKLAWKLVEEADWSSPGERKVAWERTRKRLYAEALEAKAAQILDFNSGGGEGTQ